MNNLPFIVNEKLYRTFKGADWPTYEQFLNKNYTVNNNIQKEIDNFIAQVHENYNHIASAKTEYLSQANQDRQKQIFYDKNYQIKQCKVPWDTLGINANGNVFICQSPSWIPIFVGNILESNDIFDILNSDQALKIRQEILAGRYYYCNSKICGFFDYIDPKTYQSTPISNNSPLPLIKKQELFVTSIPKSLIFDFDYTCNFKCPSCRVENINWNNNNMIRPINDTIVSKIKELIIDKIENQSISIRWGGGEPFMSEVYIDLYEYIIKKQKKNIQNVIHTNGSLLLAKKNLITRFLPYISQLRISFDAGSAEVYRVTRVGGDWDNLIENVKFIIDYVKKNNLHTKVLADFVVQKDNYKDLPNYVNLCKTLGITVNQTQKMWNWGTWDDELFKEMNVYNPNHYLYEDVKKYFQIAQLPVTKI